MKWLLYATAIMVGCASAPQSMSVDGAAGQGRANAVAGTNGLSHESIQSTSSMTSRAGSRDSSVTDMRTNISMSSTSAEPTPVASAGAGPDVNVVGSAGAGSGGAGASADAAGMGGAGAPATMPAATGRKDGDPALPVVTVDGLPCGGGQSGTQRIGGRDVTVDYPCDKHEGAHVTVILSLHGTLIGGAPYLYQHAYFSVHTLVDSHNLIVLTPESVSNASLGAQWGNEDGGQDVPHLHAVIDWAYETFSKFQIRGLWLAGHSWGARFISSTEHPVGEPFACTAKLEDKVKGVIGLSYLRMPTCASRLAMIATRGEDENITLLDQSDVAMAHGCMTPAKGPEMIGNNKYLYFSGCDNGWAHEDFEMLGKGHIDSMDPEVVEHIADTIKNTENL